MTMIIAVVAAVAGILMVVLAVLLLCKKKLSVRWGSSLLACALILACAGGMGIIRQVQIRTEEYSYIYMALCYLEEEQTDPAALYLKRVNNSQGYYLTAAQVLLEQVRGNDTVAQVRLDVLENMQDVNETEENTLERLKTWRQSETGLAGITAVLREQLPLSGRKRQELNQAFALENGGFPESGMTDMEDTLLLQINQALGSQNWYSALSSAVQLVHENASESNRLLLAEVIADVTYSGGSISTNQFLYDQQTDTDTYARESERLMVRYDDLMAELTELQQEADYVDGEDGEAAAGRSAEVAEEAETVLRQAENIFALRALNSIADIHSLEAQVVRARLYYAMRNYQEAIDTLRSSAESVQAGLSGNSSLVKSLRLVKQVYETEGEVGTDTPEFREELQVLLGSVHPQLIQLGLTPLARDFAERIISDQKTYGSGLYVVGLDASRYPEIQVRLGGQMELLESVINREMVVINDTRTTIETYEVEYNSTEERKNSICFVIDTSGSMGGSPIQDAREALNQFLDAVTGNDELALVRFESSAEILVDLTTSVGTLKAEVNGLEGGGGTDITAGIKAGTTALTDASGARTMIVMTDGQSAIDMNAVQEAVDQGITIFTIGFGSVNDELLQSIADMSGGQYLRADSSTELTNVYSSLQGIIGNTITVTYTVENTEEEERYFFLENEEYSRSVRREYYIGEETEAEPAVTLTSPPAMQTREYLENLLRQQQTTFRIPYNGTGLDTVAAAYAGDTACAITNQGENYIELEVSASLPDGVYEIRLQDQDGEIYSFPEMLIIGEQLRCWNYRAGSLLISANQALWLDNGLLVLGNGLQMNEAYVEDGEVNTLSLRLDGVLLFSGVTLPAEAAGESGDIRQIRLEQMDLGDTGVGEGHGVLSLSRDDKAYTEYVSSEILEGEILVEYDVQDSRITVGGEVAE